MAILILDVSPESAIFNTVDSSIPVKTRIDGDNQPRYVLKHSNTLQQRAFWSWPLPPQSLYGNFVGTGKLHIHWSSDSMLTGNVQWLVKAGFVRESDSVDKVLGAEVAGPIQAYSGVAGKENVAVIDLAALFTGLVDTESSRLVLQIRRNLGVASSHAAIITLLKSQFLLDFESAGSDVSDFVDLTSDTVLTVEQFFGNHTILDCTGGDVEATLPTPTAEEHGKRGSLQKLGANIADIVVPPGIAHVISGGSPSPIPLPAEGDTYNVLYRHTPTPTYYFF